MKEITSYQEYHSWKRINNFKKPNKSLIQFPKGYTEEQLRLFTLNKCAYCHTQLQTIVFENINDKYYYNQIEKLFYYNNLLDWNYTLVFDKKAYVCNNCGWWFNHEYVFEKYEEKYFQESFWKTGILKSYSVNDKDIPIAVLREYFIKDFNKIGQLNPIVFEKLIQDIYSDFYSCEVRHVGGVGDEGIDLYAVINDTPCIIQVKRRGNLALTERINYVRELIGVMLLKNVNYGHLITTANKFSDGAKEIIKSPILKKEKIKIELKTKHDIYSMLGISNNKKKNIWEKFQN